MDNCSITMISVADNNPYHDRHKVKGLIDSRSVQTVIIFSRLLKKHANLTQSIIGVSGWSLDPVA